MYLFDAWVSGAIDFNYAHLITIRAEPDCLVFQQQRNGRIIWFAVTLRQSGQNGGLMLVNMYLLTTFKCKFMHFSNCHSWFSCSSTKTTTTNGNKPYGLHITWPLAWPLAIIILVEWQQYLMNLIVFNIVSSATNDLEFSGNRCNWEGCLKAEVCILWHGC